MKVAKDKTELNWQVIQRPAEERLNLLRSRLRDFNIKRARADDGFGLAIFVNDSQGQLVAGIFGWVWGLCIEIDYLWVHEDRRRLGFGKRLVVELEKAAMARGCTRSVLDTYSFQAPEFYESLGYECFGIIDGYGPGYQKHFFKKDLRGKIDQV